MKNPDMWKVIKKILEKQKNENQEQRFIKLFVKAIESKEDREKEMIKRGLYNLEFEL